jgi:hypothetical protein
MSNVGEVSPSHQDPAPPTAFHAESTRGVTTMLAVPAALVVSAR